MCRHSEGGSSPCETAAPEPACRPRLHFSSLFHWSIFIISEKLSPLNQLVPQLMAFVKIFKAFSENKTFQFPNPLKKSVSYFSNLAMSEEIFIVRNVLYLTPTQKCLKTENIIFVWAKWRKTHSAGMCLNPSNYGKWCEVTRHQKGGMFDWNLFFHLTAEFHWSVQHQLWDWGSVCRQTENKTSRFSAFPSETLLYWTQVSQEPC